MAFCATPRVCAVAKTAKNRLNAKIRNLIFFILQLFNIAKKEKKMHITADNTLFNK
jgi:hypothetical protein